MNYFCCRRFIISEQHLSKILFRRSSFWIGSYSEVITKLIEKQLQKNQFLRYVVPNLSTKSLKNTWEEICILETCSVFMNKIFEIHLQRHSTIVLVYICVIVLNVPLIKSLKLVSVKHLLETPYLFTWYILKTK